MTMQTEETIKASTRTGKAIGRRNRALVSIAIRDEDRVVSHCWETVKRRESRKHIRACETARKIFMLGFAAYMEQMELDDAWQNQNQQPTEQIQDDLFR